MVTVELSSKDYSIKDTEATSDYHKSNNPARQSVLDESIKLPKIQEEKQTINEDILDLQIEAGEESEEFKKKEGESTDDEEVMGLQDLLKQSQKMSKEMRHKLFEIFARD